jgi:hypothetical protein
VDEKTEQLRDIFVDIADGPTVTDEQADTRGSLARGEREERLGALLDRARERTGFDTGLTDESLARVARGFYDGMDDGALADALGVSSGAVRRARLDLHLVREADFDAPLDLDALAELREAGRSIEASAAALDAAVPTVRRYRRVLATQQERRRIGDRRRAAFDELLGDADLDARTTGLRETGLEEATEGMESNVSF